MSPTLRHRSHKYSRRYNGASVETPRVPVVYDDAGQPVSNPAMVNPALDPRELGRRAGAMFKRRKWASEKDHGDNARGKSLIHTTSSLLLKRSFTKMGIAARGYKRLFRGIAGAMTWADFNRMPEPKAEKKAGAK